MDATTCLQKLCVVLWDTIITRVVNQFLDAAAMELLAGLSPSGIDFELHSVPNTADCSYYVLVLKFFRHELKTNYRFELVQACIHMLSLSHFLFKFVFILFLFYVFFIVFDVGRYEPLFKDSQ